MPKIAFIDIGELGWSLYLSAHTRWLRKQGHPIPLVMTLRGRECLYEGIADSIIQPPDDFYIFFNVKSQDCFTLYGVSGRTLKKYFNSRLPPGYRVAETQPFDCHGWREVFAGKKLFEPYPYRTQLSGKREILVFPRYRTYRPFRERNLPKDFYIKLLTRICDENRDCMVRMMGVQSGAYDITREEVRRDNYINWVGRTSSLQAVIDRCQIAVCAIGGTSVLPKLTLLQGVPSFIIGHEPERFKKHENWQRTRAGFYLVRKRGYDKFDFGECVNKVALFIKELKQ